MDAVLVSLVAVLGTLLGSVITYLFQQRTADRNESFARSERLRTERLAIYSAFAAVLTDHRNALVRVWHLKQRDPDAAEVRAASDEATRIGATIDSAIFRVHLMTDDPTVIGFADAAHLPTLDVMDAESLEELEDCERRSRDAIGTFILAAAHDVR